ncbi:DNA methyltransferase [Anaerotruncus colihominis]|uniref:Site-specific DNA-methyltransferase n=1 Tax=Anaerotruncus colihominis TaxID=169435 RepID=A0A845SUQ8_9FIRM|nr:site-specific DNA-methyltransferase [Anaerotruncus colihominis]NDO40256.1 site-specific DNA-methyltransferase [Anaerotruncus colihominis]
MTDKVDGLSMDIEAENKARLQSVFPECFTEGRLDIDKLLSLCGEYITDDFEKYEFKWKGKSDCLRLAQRRSTATLRPCPAESVNFDATQNLYIEGDNLEVLKLLQKSYFRKVKMIYIDPPYNTGSDFVYEDDFSDPMRRYVEVTQQTTKSNPETMGRYHTNWLNMMYPRLRLAANLLRDDGIIFVSIDDVELDNLKKLCNEVFGEENFIACLVYDKNRKNDAKYFSIGHEYMLVYFKSTATMNERGTVLRMTKEGIEEVKAEFERLRKLYDDDWGKVNEGLKLLYSSWDKDDPRKSLARFTRVDEKGPYRDDGNISWPGGGGPRYDVMHPVTHKPCKVPSRGWIYPNPQRMKEEIDRGRVVFGQDETTTPRIRTNLFEADKEVMRSVHFSYAQTASQTFNAIFDNRRVFENPKSIDDIKKLVEYVTVKDDCDIILDFFSGSATTAHAVMQLNSEDGGNRRFIMVQLPEVCGEKSEAFKAGYKNICEIGKERIRRAGKKILETLDRDKQPVDVGFKVFKLDTSNMKLWDDTPIEDGDLATLFDRIDGHIDGLKPDRGDEDLIFEILLKMGYPLSADLAAIDVGGLTVYKVDNGEMLICLQPGITAGHIKQMAALSPQKVVLAGHSLADSSTKANAFYLLENKGIELKTV